MLIELIIYLILVIFSFHLDKPYVPCHNSCSIYTDILSFIHHCGSIYLIFGSLLFGHYLLHLLCLLATVLGWLIFKGRCVFTIYYNRLCDIPDDTRFHDLFYSLEDHIRKEYKTPRIVYFHYITASLVALYDLKHIIL